MSVVIVGGNECMVCDSVYQYGVAQNDAECHA